MRTQPSPRSFVCNPDLCIYLLLFCVFDLEPSHTAVRWLAPATLASESCPLSRPPLEEYGREQGASFVLLVAYAAIQPHLLILVEEEYVPPSTFSLCKEGPEKG